MPNVADLQVDTPDGLGGQVKLIYGRNPPNYAVFLSSTRVLVQFADAPDQANAQRNALAPLNPLRGEINGLIDSWRTSWLKGAKAKAATFDRRVGDALIVAFEHDIEGAEFLLNKVKADLVADRTALARLLYVVVAAVLVLIVRTGAKLQVSGIELVEGAALLQAAEAGALGAFFSIALGIRDRTVLPNLEFMANSLDAALRVVIGVIAASTLIALLLSDMVELNLAPEPIDANSWLAIFILGFIGGFSERLVPDLLSKVDTKLALTQPPPTLAIKPTTIKPADASGAAGKPASSPTSDTDPLAAEAAHDVCTCEAPATNDEITPDDQLPAASGGVTQRGRAS